MCQDFVNKTPTEIDFLGGIVVVYRRALGIPTPLFRDHEQPGQEDRG